MPFSLLIAVSIVGTAGGSYSWPVVFTRLALLTCLAGLPHADAAIQRTSDSTYIQIIEQYRKGDDDAVMRLARLDAKTLESGAREVMSAFEQEPGPRPRWTPLLRAAIVAHTEAALPRRLGIAISWFPHLDLAERYAGRLAAKDRDDPVALAWWFIAIGAMHRAAVRGRRARAAGPRRGGAKAVRRGGS
jgi:hypothetical protein